MRAKKWKFWGKIGKIVTASKSFTFFLERNNQVCFCPPYRYGFASVKKWKKIAPPYVRMSENENESDFVEVRGRASEKELVMMYLILFLPLCFVSSSYSRVGAN